MAIVAIVLLGAASRTIAHAGWVREAHALWLAEHVGFNLALAFAFARTLRAGATPLITQLAHALEPNLPVDVARYTRSVTAAWAIFLLALASVSCAVYASVPFETWSVFATVGTPVLVIAMFCGEIAMQRHRYPHRRHPSIAECLRAFAQRGHPARGGS